MNWLQRSRLIKHGRNALGKHLAARLHPPENTQQLKQMLIEEWALLPQNCWTIWCSMWETLVTRHTSTRLSSSCHSDSAGLSSFRALGAEDLRALSDPRRGSWILLRAVHPGTQLSTINAVDSAERVTSAVIKVDHVVKCVCYHVSVIELFTYSFKCSFLLPSS
ncbi:hypothetical protein TNCV_1904681 [Trichonephila clavipes]|nr:hypothetical protein TNCV_1904681 [Trichonephila clavipes]